MVKFNPTFRSGHRFQRVKGAGFSKKVDRDRAEAAASSIPYLEKLILSPTVTLATFLSEIVLAINADLNYSETVNADLNYADLICEKVGHFSPEVQLKFDQMLAESAPDFTPKKTRFEIVAESLIGLGVQRGIPLVPTFLGAAIESPAFYNAGDSAATGQVQASWAGTLESATNVVCGATAGALFGGPAGAAVGGLLALSIPAAAGYDPLKTAEIISKETASLGDPVFKGTAIHIMVANGWFDAADVINTGFPDLKYKLDINGRGPLFLALIVNAPLATIRNLLDSESAKVIDKFGYSTLGIAAMVAEPEIFEEMLLKMPEEERIRQLSIVDKSGKSFSEKYFGVSQDELEKFCLEFSTNTKRASGTVYNNMVDRMRWTHTVDQMNPFIKRLGLKLDLIGVKMGGDPYTAVLATKDNFDKLYEIASSKDPKFVKARKLLFAFKNKQDEENYWKDVMNDLREIKKAGGLSAESVNDDFAKRRAANKKIFERYVPAMTVSEVEGEKAKEDASRSSEL